MKVMKSNIHD